MSELIGLDEGGAPLRVPAEWSPAESDASSADGSVVAALALCAMSGALVGGILGFVLGWLLV